MSDRLHRIYLQLLDELFGSGCGPARGRSAVTETAAFVDVVAYVTELPGQL